jgi:hypothetical protein
MDHEPEIEFEINPRPAALKRFGLSEEECVDVVSEGLEDYLQALGEAPGDEEVPSFTEHVVQVKGRPCRLGDLAEIAISGGPGVPPA